MRYSPPIYLFERGEIEEEELDWEYGRVVCSLCHNSVAWMYKRILDDYPELMENLFLVTGSFEEEANGFHGLDEVTIKEYEANYGSLEALESFCQENNIEYDRRWEAGGDYGPGEEYARIVDGELVVHELSDEGAAILNEHKETLEIITTGGNLEDIKKHLEKKINLLEPFEVTPLKAPQSIDFIKNA